MGHSQRLALVIFMSLLSSAVKAQEAIQWLSTNPVSSSLVPLYRNLPSPFPVKQDPVATESVDTAKAALEEQIKIQRAELMGLIQSQQALEPVLSILRLQAIVNGPKGYMALVSDHWVRRGAPVSVPTQTSFAYAQALQRVHALDSSISDPLQGASPRVNLTVSAITSRTLVLGNARQSYTLTLPPSGF